MRILTSEQVADGHPDKICDQVADAIVTDCLHHDPDSRVAIECLLKDDQIIIAGELTSKHEPDYRKLVNLVFDRIGRERLGYPGGIEVGLMVKKQSPDIALGVDKGGAGDQGIMYGYATNETPELLPVPYVAATKFLQILKNHPCMHANLADDGSIYVWHADTEGLNFRKAFKDAGFYLSGCCIWKKNALVLGRSPYQWIHEPCLFGWKQTGKHQWYSDRKQVTVWEYDKPRSSKDHPTMKPVALMSYPLRNSTMTNGIVLDPFLGSGSTLIACCETDRVCRGIELDPKFVDVIVKRYQSWCRENGETAEVYVIRNGQKLTFEEALAEMEAQNE